jgi:hypothetical protein
LQWHGCVNKRASHFTNVGGRGYDSRNNIIGHVDFDIGRRSACMAAQPFVGLWANGWNRFGVVDTGDLAGDGGGLAAGEGI